MGIFRGPKIDRTGLVVMYDFASLRSYSGSGTSVNSVVGNYPGTLNNGPIFNSGNGGYLTFDGVNDSVSSNSDINLYTLSTGTLTVWLKKTSLTNRYEKVIALTVGDTTTYPLMISQDNGNAFYSYLQTTTGAYNSFFSTNPSLNTWNQLTCVYDGSYLTNYLNGVYSSQSSANGNFLNASGIKFRLGWSYNSEYWTGNIAMGMFYDRALSAVEILNNYNATKNRFS
jgi:hypothetical protein